MHVPINDEGYQVLTPRLRFGQLVRDRRKALNISQEALAQQLRAEGLPLTQTQVSRVEEGKRPVDFDEAAAMCRVLGVDPVDAASSAFSEGGASARSAERAAWLDVQSAERALKEQADQFAQAGRELAGQRAMVHRARETWELAQRRMEPRAPARDLAALEATLQWAQYLLGKDADQ